MTSTQDTPPNVTGLDAPSNRRDDTKTESELQSLGAKFSGKGVSGVRKPSDMFFDGADQIDASIVANDSDANIPSAEGSKDESEAKSTPDATTFIHALDDTEKQCFIPAGASSDIKSIIYFDIDSDLDIPFETEGGLILCKVSSAHLALASPVWRNMLYGNNYIKRSDEEAWVVSIDGYASALMTLFHIIHYEFDKVPVKLPLEELYRIAVVISRYKCTHLIYPWAETWINSLPTNHAPEENYRNSRKAMFIAWVLGDVSLFRRSVEQIVLSSKLVTSQLVDSDGNSLSDVENIHEDLLGWIGTTRLETISLILDALSEPFRRPSSGDKSPKPPFCKLGTQQKECETMMLGSMVPQLMAAGLFPVPEPREFLDSIDTLKSKINNFKYTPYEGRDWMPHLSHISCSLGYSEAVEASLADMQVPLDCGFMDDFVARSRISGIRKTLGYYGTDYSGIIEDDSKVPKDAVKRDGCS
ncbi:hypothetical protein Daesc_010591 [Daldinia eschscholtzii]|uniref:BTB domain-containing protein n=1 Tax=Daldinia eschscholtzii TaxID=292717 RepID=A0AAX6M838_9PEZI